MSKPEEAFDEEMRLAQAELEANRYRIDQMKPASDDPVMMALWKGLHDECKWLGSHRKDAIQAKAEAAHYQQKTERAEARIARLKEALEAERARQRG